MKTSLGIWALGTMATRFVPGGYQPQWAGESTADRVRRAVDGLGELIDDYEFHYPQELNEDNLDEVREALGDRVRADPCEHSDPGDPSARSERCEVVDRARGVEVVHRDRLVLYKT